MSESIKRFHKIQEIKRQVQKRKDSDITVRVDWHEPSLIEHNDSEYTVLADYQERWQDIWRTVSAPITVTVDEVEELLSSIYSSWDKSKFDVVFQQCQQSVISSIVGPLGLGALISAYDKNGGNVDTLHNVEKGVYSSESERRRYEDRESYDSTVYHSDPNYIARNRELNAQKKDQGVEDAYSGKKLTSKDATDLDHVVAANEIHNDPRRFLAEMDGKALANTESNLVMTTSSVNRSKKAKRMDEFVAQQQQKKAARQERIKALSAQENLSDQDRKELQKLKEFEALDEERMLRADEIARSEITKQLNKAYYTSTKFAKNVAITSGIEAGKMGLQQAFGLLLTDFFSALFEEVRDSYNNGFQEGVDASGFFEAVAIRCERVAITVVADWRNVVTAFRDGAMSGFLSNLFTTAINAFATTAKNLVRIIREGTLSILRAIKILLFRPEGMTFSEAMDSALKLIITGALTIGGIALDEYLRKVLLPLMSGIPVISDFSNILVTILSGGLTGVATALVIYAIDRMDPFGVRAEERHVYVMETISKARDESHREIDASFLTDAWAVPTPQ